MSAPTSLPASRRFVAPPFRPRFPWLGGDLQTMRNYLVPRAADLSPWPSRRIELSVGDGSGDRMLGTLHAPAEADALPLAVLVHGLTGCEDSFYILETARHLLEEGLAVLRLNLRGAGPSRRTCTGHYSAASNDDLGRALAALDPALTSRGLVLVGFSLGGSIVLRYLAMPPVAVAPLCAVVISVPIDLAATARRMMSLRNALYHRWLLNRMKREATGGAARTTPAERAAIDAARTVYAFDDGFVGPRNGFAGAEESYARCSAAGFLDRIGTPTLVVHGRNDPWIPAAAFDAVDWDALPAVSLALARGGGHVGFHGRRRETPWHNLCLSAFLERHRGAATAA